MTIPTSTDPHLPSPAPAEQETSAAWSAVLQKKPAPVLAHAAAPSRVFAGCGSSRGVSVAVVDANAIIHGDKITGGGADKFVTVQEVLDEVRDPSSRRRLAFLSLPIETMEPSPEAISTVVKFARETGDYPALSAVDLKLIALTYMLEAQIHGTSHLRERPPPLRVVCTKNLRESEMPGWGSNVPNLKEWEALDQVAHCDSGQASRILPLKNLVGNIISVASGGKSEDQENDTQSMYAPRRSFPPKKEIKIVEKKMVATGIDASQGEDADNAGDWRPVVSRSTHRRFLIRKARRELHKASEEDSHLCPSVGDDNTIASNVDSENQLDGEGDISIAHSDEGDDETTCVRELNDLEISSQNDESIDTTLIDDDGSEQRWMAQSLSDSSVACITSDYAMQNVILQIGLRLLAPGGMQILQLHKWVLRCHACNNVTQDMDRIFCPKCGNGGTLRKVSATVGENGIVLATRRQRMILRGTKFSLPKPQGGRDAITKNPILREDQLPHKFLHPKIKKKPDKGDSFFSSDDFFSHTGNKKASLQPPVRRAMAMFSGRRNPNDNHFSRPKH